jgi:PAS domain S-box-containing protein
LTLTRAISRSRTVDDIYDVALDTLAEGLGVSRASILLFDADGVMRFKAYRGLSESYRRAVEGHTPWEPGTPDPGPVVVNDVATEPSLAPFLPIIQAEGIGAMAFIPLVSLDRVIGKFMLYYDQPTTLRSDELGLAGVIASEVAFAVERRRAEDLARRSEERLRFALDAASMSTWEWDLGTRFDFSANLERLHGLTTGSLDGTFDGYLRHVHHEDRDGLLRAVERALTGGTPLDVEYRVLAGDGSVRWVEAKGRVEYDDERPVRLTCVCLIATRRKEEEMARLAAFEEAGRLKDEFLATLSHELRTPLSAILGWVQLLQTDVFTPDRTQLAIEVISRNARLQSQLIEDILDVSRIITGKLEIERLPVSVPQLVGAVLAGMRPALDAKHLDIDIDVPDDLPVIEGDPKRLQQIVSNLVSNATKFTPEGGRVVITCRADDGAVVLKVSDTGIGVDPSFLPHMFDRFRQADSRSTRRHGGLGLGLAITRHLVEQHRGEIRAESDGPGRGTTMIVRLPVGDASADAFHHLDAPTALAGSEPALRGLTVVIVDDQEDSCELLAAFFERMGATGIKCDSALAALAALRVHAADLVVADLAMPEIDGFELVRRIRERTATLPVVAVSAYARPQDRAKALHAGFNAFCAKPLDWNGFVQAVRDALPAPAQWTLAGAGSWPRRAGSTRQSG